MKRKPMVLFVIMLCWWSFLFPELTFNEDALKVVYVQKEEEEILPQEIEDIIQGNQWEKYKGLLSATPQQVKIKSRMWEWLKEVW